MHANSFLKHFKAQLNVLIYIKKCFLTSCLWALAPAHDTGTGSQAAVPDQVLGHNWGHLGPQHSASWPLSNQECWGAVPGLPMGEGLRPLRLQPWKLRWKFLQKMLGILQSPLVPHRSLSSLLVRVSSPPISFFKNEKTEAQRRDLPNWFVLKLGPGPRLLALLAWCPWGIS